MNFSCSSVRTQFYLLRWPIRLNLTNCSDTNCKHFQRARRDMTIDLSAALIPQEKREPNFIWVSHTASGTRSKVFPPHTHVFREEVIQNEQVCLWNSVASNSPWQNNKRSLWLALRVHCPVWVCQRANPSGHRDLLSPNGAAGGFALHSKKSMQKALFDRNSMRLFMECISIVL